MAEVLLKLENITKFYGQKLIFRNVSFQQESGTFSLLTGLNGSGKSTLLKIMAGLCRPTSGKCRSIGGSGYLGHATFLYAGLTAMENLSFWAKTYGLKETKVSIEAILDRVGLAAFAQERTAVFSRGMAQRLNFARILLLEPKLLLLDEPFTGLDPNSTAMMWRELNLSIKKGAAIIMVSHAPDKDLALADHIYILENNTLKITDSQSSIPQEQKTC